MATIDPSIALGVKPVQIENPLVAQGRAMESAVNALKYQELQRGLQEEQEVLEEAFEKRILMFLLLLHEEHE